jgi:hypothetical protein
VIRQEVVDNTGFEMLFDDPLPVTPEPTEGELQILRGEVDPERIIIGK